MTRNQGSLQESIVAAALREATTTASVGAGFAGIPQASSIPKKHGKSPNWSRRFAALRLRRAEGLLPDGAVEDDLAGADAGIDGAIAGSSAQKPATKSLPARADLPEPYIPTTVALIAPDATPGATAPLSPSQIPVAATPTAQIPVAATPTAQPPSPTTAAPVEPKPMDGFWKVIGIHLESHRPELIVAPGVTRAEGQSTPSLEVPDPASLSSCLTETPDSGVASSSSARAKAEAAIAAYIGGKQSALPVVTSGAATIKAVERLTGPLGKL